MRLAALLLLSLIAEAAPMPGVAQPAPDYVVFFQEWSAALDDSAQAVIGRAAAWAKAHPSMQVDVTGFADPTGSRNANLLLSELRAQVVVDQLAGDGVSESRIHPVGQGSVKPALSSQESRRVQVSFRPD
ncbi:MAG TPA: OmpA family protein [Acetobacteraceae bacterium]|nr:OmpA family protein [Acetobacteraceae bacterium]